MRGHVKKKEGGVRDPRGRRRNVSPGRDMPLWPKKEICPRREGIAIE